MLIRMPISVALALAAVCVGGQSWGQTVIMPAGRTPTAREPAPLGVTVASETFLGMLACDRCAGTRVELTLYRAGEVPGSGEPAAYHLRETLMGTPYGDDVRESNGTWIESLAPDNGRDDEVRWLIQLSSGRPTDREFFERTERHQDQLLVLDSQQHELPADLPHKLGRVSGEHQLHMVSLSEADNGRTLELKPGEVFVLRLETRKPAGYSWTSNRPAAMALLETGAEPPAAAPATNTARSVRTSAAARPTGPEYQVWQFIAPPAGVVQLRFELKQTSDMKKPPLRVYTLTVVTQ